MSWKRVAEAFHTSWDNILSAVERAVGWGRAHQDFPGTTALGIDEITAWKGHKYLTLVYQIDAHCWRLLWVGQTRTVTLLLRFFSRFGKERSQALRFVCSDM